MLQAAAGFEQCENNFGSTLFHHLLLSEVCFWSRSLNTCFLPWCVKSGTLLSCWISVWQVLHGWNKWECAARKLWSLFNVKKRDLCEPVFLWCNVCICLTVCFVFRFGNVHKFTHPLSLWCRVVLTVRLFPSIVSCIPVHGIMHQSISVKTCFNNSFWSCSRSAAGDAFKCSKPVVHPSSLWNTTLKRYWL